MTRRTTYLLLCGTLLSAAACDRSGQPDSIVRSTAPASGKITYADGRPVTGAWLIFHPKDPPGNEATAATGPDGTFKLGTFKKNDGAVPGRYVVTVAPMPGAKGQTFPKKYTEEKTSDLAVEITKGENALSLRLK
jgi:hypothetical protein